MLNAKVWAEGRWASQKDDLMSEGKWVPQVHIAFSHHIDQVRRMQMVHVP